MFIHNCNHNTRFIITTIVTLMLAACEESPGTDEAGSETDSETGGDMSLAIIGSYDDEFGDTHTITETEWTNSAGSFAISQWDNDEMWLVAQNAETNMYNPGQWSRFDWTWDGEQLYYCQSVYDGLTIEDALAGSADASDLMAGCGTFAWTALTP
jgi:hypothetical protein